MTTVDDALSLLANQPDSTPLGQAYLLGFDTETTGISTDNAIVSASLVLRNPAEGFSEDVKQDWVINPHRSISPAASAVNGFTNEYLREHGQQPEEALEQIATCVADAQNLSIPLLAYNAPFDIRMLENDLTRWHLRGLGARLSRLDLLVVDPLVIDRAISHRHGRRNLSATTQYYHVSPHGDFHDAATDTIAALDLVAPMCDSSKELAGVTIGDVMDWQRSAYKKWALSFNEWAATHGRHQVSTQWM